MPTVDSSGVTIRYRSDGEGPLVVLAHGGGLRLEAWDRSGWVDGLAEDHQVVRFDARGHGESSKPTDPDDYAMGLMVRDVLAVADACGGGDFHYLGWSMGAKLGWGVADVAPGRLASLGLIGADAGGSDDSAGEMVQLLEQGLDTVVGVLSQMWDVPDWLGELYRQNDVEALLAYFRSTWPDLSHVPEQLDVPTLLLCGERDEVYEGMTETAAQAGVDLVTLEAADHVSSLTHDGALSAYRDFLTDVTG
ncbi:MAG: alpha/beta hydrolase [Nitriliruptorales bacterium]|nr:alpha/beta hydrolase [Nitriliruptorales bacterium]